MVLRVDKSNPRKSGGVFGVGGSLRVNLLKLVLFMCLFVALKGIEFNAPRYFSFVFHGEA